MSERKFRRAFAERPPGRTHQRSLAHRAPPGRAIHRVITRTYRGLLDEIEKRNYDVFSRRVRLPRWRKAAILAGAWPVKWGLM